MTFIRTHGLDTQSCETSSDGAVWLPQIARDLYLDKCRADESTGTLVAASASTGRLYRSTDKGKNWEQTGTFSGAISDLLAGPGLFSLIYARAGVIYSKYSLDDGRSWTEAATNIGTTGSGPNHGCYFPKALRFYIALYGGDGVAASFDTITWTNVLTGAGDIYDVNHNEDFILATGAAGGGPVNWSSPSGSNGTWTQGALGVGFACVIGIPGVGFVGGAGAGVGIWKTINNGSSWAQVDSDATDYRIGIYAEGIAMIGDGGSGSSGSKRSLDAGDSWLSMGGLPTLGLASVVRRETTLTPWTGNSRDIGVGHYPYIDPRSYIDSDKPK